MFFESLKTISLWTKGFKFKTKNKTILGHKHIKRPEVSLFDLLPKKYGKLPFFSEAAFTAETTIKYEGYIENERQRMIAVQKLEALLIPQDFDYNKLQGLSNESKLRLIKIRPQTLGQASRISGIRPTDITLIGLSIKVSRETV